MNRLVALTLLVLLAADHVRSDDDDDEAGLERIVERFRNGSAAERRAAAHRIGRLGPKSWHIFAPCLTHADPDVRRRARLLWERLLASNDGWWCVPRRGTTFDPVTKLPLRVIEKNSGAELVLVLPGRFPMGSNAGPRDEGPAHEVEIRRPYYLGRFELTQAEYRRGLPESYYFSSRARGRYPATGLSWKAIQPFLERTGLRLPTEAEWEFAARAGYDPHGVDALAWHRANGGGKPHEVGTKQPNPLGFSDLLGNVAEWTSSQFEPYDGDERRTQGRTGRVVRGGSVTRGAGDCRPTARRPLPADFRSDAIGFRVARDP